IVRAALEATCFQTREVVEAMEADSGIALTSLHVDGGMVANELLMQLQSDILDTEVIRPREIETTALGAAFAAGLGQGFWEDLNALEDLVATDKSWTPNMDEEVRDQLYAEWNKAVERTLDWEEKPFRAQARRLNKGIRNAARNFVKKHAGRLGVPKNRAQAL